MNALVFDEPTSHWDIERFEYAHQTRHQLVVNDATDFYVFEDLKIRNMTKRRKVKRDTHGRFLPHGRNARAGPNRAILASAWGDVVSFTRYKALRQGKLVLTVPLLGLVEARRRGSSFARGARIRAY